MDDNWWFNGPADYDELPDITRDRMLADAMRNRYGTQDPKVIEDLFHKELGLQPYKIRVAENPELQPKYNVWGAYQSDPGRIVNQKGAGDNSVIATRAHELAHLADHVLATPTQVGPDQSPLHHGNFRNFEPDMADLMEEQRLIEAGVPADKLQLTKYPWLRKLNPKSSNRLASPWAGAKQDISPEIYNGTRNQDAVKKLLQDLDHMND